MEFSHPVVLFDDFKPGCLPSAIPDGRKLKFMQKEMLNLIYVAITRARQKLLIAPGLCTYLQDMGLVFGNSRNAGASTQFHDEEGRAAREAAHRNEMRDQREEWERRWDEFDKFRNDHEHVDPLEVLGRIPRPPQDVHTSDNPFAIDPQSSAAEVKEFLKKRVLLLHHPDKFQVLIDRVKKSPGWEARNCCGRVSGGPMTQPLTPHRGEAMKCRHVVVVQALDMLNAVSRWCSGELKRIREASNPQIPSRRYRPDRDNEEQAENVSAKRRRTEAAGAA